MITTVGDQIFALTREIKKLKNRCEKYKEIVRRFAAESRSLHADSGAPQYDCTQKIPVVPL